MQEHKAWTASERAEEEKDKPIKFPSSINNSPEVQRHQLQERVLFYVILHYLLKETMLDR